MKINRPNNWVWHQHFASQEVNTERGTAYVITNADLPNDEAKNRVDKLRAVVTEVTGMPTDAVRVPFGFTR